MTINRKAGFLITISVLFFIVCGIIVVSKFADGLERMGLGKPASEYYFKDYYSGQVINKFINKQEHNYKTIIIESNQIQKQILFDFEIGGLYEYLEIGDTIKKEKNSLDLILSRNGTDSIVKMKIYDNLGN